jgi:hypothetical protein
VREGSTTDVDEDQPVLSGSVQLDGFSMQSISSLDNVARQATITSAEITQQSMFPKAQVRCGEWRTRVVWVMQGKQCHPRPIFIATARFHPRTHQKGPRLGLASRHKPETEKVQAMSAPEKVPALPWPTTLCWSLSGPRS